jgi:hypothetical protein
MHLIAIRCVCWMHLLGATNSYYVPLLGASIRCIYYAYLLGAPNRCTQRIHLIDAPNIY